MSAQLWILGVLREAGCRAVAVDGWRARGRPGEFDPKGVLIHHTGATASLARPMPSLSTLVHGRPDLNGPLCQLGLGFDGIYRMVAAGRANHAGMARASGPMPAGDGNAMYIGIEVDYSGSQDMSKLQYAALTKGTAALLKHLGKSEAFARGHKETSSAGKWDPGKEGSGSPLYLMGPIRQDILEHLAPPPEPPIPPPGPTWVEWRAIVAGKIMNRQRADQPPPPASMRIANWLATAEGQRELKAAADAGEDLIVRRVRVGG